MRYGEVPRLLWRKPEFRDLSVNGRLCYLALLTGSAATALPGLVECDKFGLASVAALELEAVAAALTELVSKRFVEVDPANTLIRLIGVPWADGEQVKSYKVLRGWWHCWRELPSSPLRVRHIESLRAAVDLSVAGKPADGQHKAQPSMQDEWNRTFGTVRPVDTLSEGLPHTLSDSPSIPASASASASASAKIVFAATATPSPPRPPTAAPVLPGLEAHVGAHDGGAQRATGEATDRQDDGDDTHGGAQRTPKSPTYCTRDQALQRIAEASGGRFVASKPGKGGVFKLDAVRRRPNALEVCELVGEWLGAGGDGWREAIDGRAVGPNLDAWIAQSEAWDQAGRPPLDGKAVTKPHRAAAPSVAPWKPPVNDGKLPAYMRGSEGGPK